MGPFLEGEQLEFARRLPLDGLRGVFVLVVILFHLDFKWIRVGYVGVDAFFVLSGFVITSILAMKQPIVSGRSFSFSNFYARRCKRLLPVSAFVLLSTAAATRLLTTAATIHRLRAAFLSASAYSENWYLVWSSRDYFSQGTGRSPVLHFWSLAVEEQFYLAWPLLVYLAYKLGGSHQRVLLFAIGLLVLCCAFTLACAFQEVPSSLLYYGTQFRVYQLLVGACLALWQLSKSEREVNQLSGPFSSTMSVIGLASFLLLCFYPNEIAPLLAGAIATGCMTLMIIGFERNSSNFAAEALSSPLFQRLGLYSYSMYLWHYPLIFADEMTRPFDTEMDLVRGVFLILATIVCAAVSRVLIEKPLQNLRISSRSVLVVGVILSLFVSSGTFVLLSDASKGTIARDQGILDFEDHESTDSSLPSTDSEGRETAGLGPALMVGDSYLEEWTYTRVLDNIKRKRGIEIEFAMVVATPWMKVTPDWTGGKPRVEFPQETLWDAINRQPPPKSLILFSHSFSSHLRLRSASDPESPWTERLTPEWKTVLKEGAKETLKDVSEWTRIVIVLPHMNLVGAGMEKCLQNGSPRCSAKASKEEGYWEARATLAEFAKENQITVLNMDEFICPKKVCQNVVKGNQQFRDEVHISPDYALFVAPQFEALLGHYL